MTFARIGRSVHAVSLAEASFTSLLRESSVVDGLESPDAISLYNKEIRFIVFKE